MVDSITIGIGILSIILAVLLGVFIYLYIKSRKVSSSICPTCPPEKICTSICPNCPPVKECSNTCPSCPVTGECPQCSVESNDFYKNLVCTADDALIGQWQRKPDYNRNYTIQIQKNTSGVYTCNTLDQYTFDMSIKISNIPLIKDGNNVTINFPSMKTTMWSETITNEFGSSTIPRVSNIELNDSSSSVTINTFNIKPVPSGIVTTTAIVPSQSKKYIISSITEEGSTYYVLTEERNSEKYFKTVC